MADATLSNLLQEDRRFPPSAEVTAYANGTQELFDKANSDFEAFWAEQAHKYVTWSKDFDQVLDWSDAPFAKWFVGGELNAAYNCVDRHVEEGKGDKVAIHFVGEPGDTRDITYADLKREVSKAANMLTSAGVNKGDVVMIYLPMIPEAAIAMLACARIGAPHSVVFGGFSADALRSRTEDSKAKVIVTSDAGYRRGKPSALKPAVDESLQGETTVEKVIVVNRCDVDVEWTEGRDLWWHEEMEKASEEHEPVANDSEHPLFILYTSGTTGKPKGILHTTGGYLVQNIYATHVVHDVHPDEDVYWCTADVGWVTGHSYIVYGPLGLGATEVMYEGTPDSPHKGRWWEIIQDKKVSVFYTAPTAIRACMKWGVEHPQKYDLSSIRILGSVGEPINPEAWMWYRGNIGGDKAPVVDTWWQTETGAIMISPLPGVTSLCPGSAQYPIPGIAAEVVDDAGNPVANGQGGYLVLTKPWPAMLRGIWGDPQRYKETYWGRWPNVYFAGDGAKKDDDGNIWVLGRVDDVMNVSGHRLSTSEIESALVSHPMVAEAAVVGATDELTGQAVVAFVILREDAAGADESKISEELRAHVGHEIGAIAKPKSIMVVSELPKTRSGKIMRRLLRDVAENREVGDVTTLADAGVMEFIKKNLKKS